MKKEEAKVITHPKALETPPDVAISRVMQNLFATYGENKVRNTLKELFNLKTNNKKVA